MADLGKSRHELAQERTEQVYQMLIDGVGRKTVLHLASEWGVTQRTVRNHITAAEERIGREAGLKRQSYLGRVLMHLEHLLKMALDEGDRPEARKVLKDIRDMLGLDEAVEIRHLVPDAWHKTFDDLGIRRPGNGKGNGAGGNGKDESPQVRH